MVKPQEGKRISKIDMYLNCAETFAYRINPKDNSIHKAKPCPLCARSIIQAGIHNVILRVGEGEDHYVIVPATELEWFQKAED